MRFCYQFAISAFLLTSLSCGSAEQKGQPSQENKQDEAGSKAEATVLIVTASEKYESLMIKTVGNNMDNFVFRDTVDLGSREGIFCQNIPKNPGTHYGFQTSEDLSSYFIAMYKGNMMQQKFAWCRLYKYSPANEEWTQLISFGKVHQPIWKYVEEAGAIVYYDKNAGLLLSHRLKNGATDTIRALNIDVRQHALSSVNGQVQLTYVDEGQVRRLIYESSSGEVEEEVLAEAEDFSSTYQAYVLQLYFTDPENQGFRLYKDKELIADQPFTVGNVNSFWNESGQFYLQGEKEIFLMNPQLDTLEQRQMNSPFIYNVLDQHVIAHERSQHDRAQTQAYLLPKDLSGKQQTDLLDSAAWVVLVKNI